MRKYYHLKEYLTPTEKIAVEALKNIKPEGQFNQVIISTLHQGKTDMIRLIFKMIREQTKGTSKERMVEVLGNGDVLEAVLLT